MYCDTNQFPTLPFCGPHTKPYGARGLSKNYHVRFDPKLDHCICVIRRIPCACVGCTSILESWYSVKEQARYQTVTNCNYWPILGSYNNCNIIELTPKSTHFEEFYEIHQVVLDKIIENMASLVQSGMYGAMNTYYTTKMDSMSLNSSQIHTHYKIIQQFMDRLFLLVNQLSRHNIFALCNKKKLVL